MAQQGKRGKAGDFNSLDTTEGYRREPPKDTVEFDGVVVEQMRNASFRVELENGHTLLARVAGKMRRYRIRVMPGDRVQVAMSTYDTSMGRITFRYRN